MSSPLRTLLPSASAEVLAVLAGTSEELTGNAIAAIADGRVSQTGANKALKRLVASGVVLARPAGSSILYALNRNHLAASAVVELAGLRATFLQRVSDAVEAWKPPAVSVVLFGSVARGDAGLASDIDLLVVRPDTVAAVDLAWERQIEELTESVQRWTGNPCQILEYGESELAALVSAGDSLVDNLRTDGIAVAGASPRSLLSGRRR
jgi:predicted nucleotidyltransferase